MSETVKDNIVISKFSKCFPCSSRTFLNFRVTSTRLLTDQFLIKKNVYRMATCATLLRYSPRFKSFE